MRTPQGTPSLLAAGMVVLLAGCVIPRPKAEETPGSWWTRGEGYGPPPGTPGYRGPDVTAGLRAGAPTFDGHVMVEGVRGRSTRKTLGSIGGGIEVGGEEWRVELAGGAAYTSSTLGIPDQAPSNILVDSDTDNQFGHFHLGAGPCLLDTRPRRGEEEAAGETGEEPRLGTRVDLVGGVWVESHNVSQYVFLLGDRVTERSSWVLPFAGLRAGHSISSRFRLEERVDFAGHRPEGDVAWRVEAALGIRCGPYVWVDLGWSFHRIDVESGGASGEEVDADFSGPFVGLVWRF